MANNAQGDWVDVPQTPAKPQTTAGQGDWVDVPTTPATTPAARGEKALTKATGLKAQPKPFSKQWFKEAGFRGTAATAEALPGIAATIGGIAGSGVGGGTTFGMGAVPGAVTGATILGGGGEAARQLILRSLGFPSPTTSTEAAKDIGTQAAIQGTIQAGTEGLGRGLPALLRRWGLEQYYRAINPTKQVTKAIARDVTPELIERGESGTLTGLQKRAAERVQTLGPQLDLAYAQTPASATAGSRTQILKDLDTLKSKYLVKGVNNDPAAVSAIEGLQKVINKNPVDMDPISLRQLRQIYDETLERAGEYRKAGLPFDLPTSLTVQAQEAAANSIRRIMGAANPDIAALNKEMHFWIQVRDVMTETLERRTGQSGGLVRTLWPLVGATVAFGGHGTAERSGLAVAGVVGTELVTRMVRSPLWATTSSVVKDRVADALARGDVQAITALAARFGIAAPAAYERATQPLPGQVQTPNNPVGPLPQR